MNTKRVIAVVLFFLVLSVIAGLLAYDGTNRWQVVVFASVGFICCVLIALPFWSVLETGKTNPAEPKQPTPARLHVRCVRCGFVESLNLVPLDDDEPIATSRIYSVCTRCGHENKYRI